MSQVIIFKNDNGGVSVVRPAPEALKAHTIEQVAAKDVPPKKVVTPTGVFEPDPETGEQYEINKITYEGRPYKIIDESELPSRDFRDAWTVDEAQLTDGVGNTSNKWE